MPHRDDLIGLLRSLDGAMKTAAPPLGHEARMRARIAERAGGRRVARPIALAFCAIAAGAATWLAWSSSREPETSVQPLAAPSASDVVAEPRPDPSAPALPLRPSPRRAFPALPLLPPHSDLAPSPPQPSPEAPPAPRDAPDPESPARVESARAASAMNDKNTMSVTGADRETRQAVSRGQSTSPSIAWGAPASAGAGSRTAGLTSIGTLTGDPRPSGASNAGATHGSSSPGANGGTTTPVSKPDGQSVTCESEVLDFGGKCVSSFELKDIAVELCDAKGLSTSGLDAPYDCPEQGSSMMKVTCCPSGDAAPPDPYAACKPITAGDGVTCLDAALLEKQAAETCAAWGMALAKPEIGGACAAGSATVVGAVCCPPTAPANDPGPQPAGAVGDGAGCVPNDKLEDAANSICLAQGLTLADFWTADDCDADSSTTGKYVCGK